MNTSYVKIYNKNKKFKLKSFKSYIRHSIKYINMKRLSFS